MIRTEVFIEKMLPVSVDSSIYIDGKKVVIDEAVAFNGATTIYGRLDLTEHQQEMEELNPKCTRVEYELINKKSFFDLSDAFNLGEIFFDANGDKDKKSKVLTELHLSQLFFRGGANIYCKVEVGIDEKSFVMDLLDDGTQDAPCVEFHGSAMTIDGGISIKEMRAITDALDDDGKFK